MALPPEPYSYDFPEDVAPALGTSLSHLLGATNPTQKKKGECLRRGQQGAGPGPEQGASGGLSGAELTRREAGRPDPSGKRAGRRWRSESSPSTFLPENVGRKIQIQRSGHLNLYLLLDASQSVSEKDFGIFKNSAILMVDRVRE